MQTLQLSISPPDAAYPNMEVRLSAHDSAGDVVIALPLRSHSDPASAMPCSPPLTAEDEYQLGGYAGI